MSGGAGSGHGMTLNHLLNEATDDAHIPSLTVTDLTLDSREVVPGSCFLALQGAAHCGDVFIAEAASRGAVAVLSEKSSTDENGAIPVIRVEGLRDRLGLLANRFFETPSANLKLCGVTGTNGKTSVAHLTTQAFDALGTTSAYVGTLGLGRLPVLEPSANTTPDVIRINRLLAQFKSSGVGAVALEVSSHALAQDRLQGLHFHTAAFTNLGHDHLDYHGSLEAYAEAKRRLFTQADVATAVINIDDALGQQIATGFPDAQALWCCTSRDKNCPVPGAHFVCAREIEIAADFSRFVLEVDGLSAPVRTEIGARFNVDNLLLTAGILSSAGFDVERIAQALQVLKAVPGRLESCGRTCRGAQVFIDYAHSPDSLAAVLTSLRELTDGRILLVFGCGGDRDRSKRPLMGDVAIQSADLVFVTADNPRSETVGAIAREILGGNADAQSVTVIEDRAAAIRCALNAADAGDCVLIAGKGHETTQESQGVFYAFSDRDCVAGLLRGAPS